MNTYVRVWKCDLIACKIFCAPFAKCERMLV